MDSKAKITLTPEQETLLITLYAKAQPENPFSLIPGLWKFSTRLIMISEN